MSIIEEKSRIRKSMQVVRSKIDSHWKINYDAEICQKLIDLVSSNKYRNVHCYISMPGEIDTTIFLQKLLESSIVTICPKTLPSRLLENRILHSLDNLETGIKGTKHPAEENIFTGSYDLIIVPGLAYDPLGYRLGYGGGYYDSFLTSQPNAQKVGIFYPFQKMDKVPIEPHDACLDKVISL